MCDPALGRVCRSNVFATLWAFVQSVALCFLATATPLAAAPLFPPPVDGWAYELIGNQTLFESAAALDGTWNHENGSDSWSGDGRGAGNGLVGGVSSTGGILSFEDGLTSGSSALDNRRLYFTHNVGQDAQVTDGNNLLDQGVTIYFRARLTPPTDPLVELSGAPDGFVNQGAGKGMIGIRQSGASGMIISFSLSRASEETAPSTSVAFGQAGLHMNNLNGNSRTLFVDPDGPGTRNLLTIDPTIFHDYWITIVDNGADPGTHRVTIYVDGSLTPNVFNVTAGTGNDGPAINYLAIGPGTSSQVGAFDLDFLAYRQGAVSPSSFQQPPAIVVQPSNQFTPAGVKARFEVTASGTPPLTYNWYRNGALVSSSGDRFYETPPVTQSDNGAQFRVIINNAFGSVTSQPPATLTFLPPPQITTPPMNVTATNGGTAIMSVQASSLVPPVYQWVNVNGPIPGETNSTLFFPLVTEGLAGPYWVTVSNAAGGILSSPGILTVVSFDFGDAADLVFSYSTRLENNGARHVIKAGYRLGALIDAELDAISDGQALGDDATLDDDEDGILFPGPILVGSSAVAVDVTVSTNGFLQGWLDMAGNGTWVDPGDQIFLNRPVVAGVNHLTFAIPDSLLTAATYARFRFSSVANIGPSGPAPDGEVEDYRVTLTQQADVRLTATAMPEPVAVGSNVTISALITNLGPAVARVVYFTNIYPSQATLVSAETTAGSCLIQGNIVRCPIPDMAPRTAVAATIVVRPTAVGSMTNFLAAFRPGPDPNYANNVLTVVSSVRDAPSIVSPPASISVAFGNTANFSVTAAGFAPLSYQWFFGSTPLAGQTGSTLAIPSVDQAKAGTYSVRVTNPVGAVTSVGAILTVLFPPVIQAHPQNVTNFTGSSVNFSVSATGSSPFSYFWFFNNTFLPGASGPTLQLANVVAGQAGQYSVLVSNAVGVATSNPASLVLTSVDFGDAPAPYPTLFAEDGARHRLRDGYYLGSLIDYDPDGRPGSTGLGDDAAGSDDEDGITFGDLRLGQVTSAQVVASTNGVLNGWIDFNGDGDWADEGEQIFVNRALAKGINPLTVSVPSGAQPGATFGRFRFSSTGGLGVQGEAADGEVEDYRLVIGAIYDLTLTPEPLALGPRGGPVTYSIMVSNKGPSLVADVMLQQTFSGPLTLLGDDGTQGCVQEGTVVRCFLGQLNAQSTVAFSVTISPNQLGSLTNQMVVSGVGLEANPADNAGMVVTTILEPPAITVHPQPLTVTNGQTATFTASASGSGLTLRWRFNGNDIPNANASTLVLNNVQLSADGLYTLVASNVVGTASSLPARLTVLAAPVITGHPQSQSAIAGTNLTLSVTVTGSQPLSYQWEFNGADLPGQAGPTLLLSNIDPAQEGTYRVRVSNPLGQAISSPAAITVVIRPTITQHPVSQTVWAGQSAQFSVVATGTAPLQYQWLWNGVPLGGANVSSYTVANAQQSQNGSYSVIVTNFYGAATSQVAQLSVMRVDFGDAPDDIYPSKTNHNGAYHLITPGVYLGAGVDDELDSLANSSATGDDLNGTDDEDGVRVVGTWRIGQVAALEVVASTNGFMDGWIDFFQAGLWVDPGDQIFQAQPVQAGTNMLTFNVLPTAAIGTTFARFRFSTTGGYEHTGPAANGEVEDYQVTIGPPFDLELSAEPVPAEGAIGTPNTYVLRVTNRENLTATQVVLVDTLGENMSFVSAVPSQGSCGQLNGVVTCQLGTLVFGQTATITIQAVPTQGGSATNRAVVSAAEYDPTAANNAVVQVSRIVQHIGPFGNNGLINIATLGSAQPYPSTITVGGVLSVIDRISVTLSNITHAFPDDIDVLLVGPTGLGIILMSDAGGGNSVSSATLTFDDAAALRLPDLGGIQSGTVRPGNFGDQNDPFPSPAPAGLWDSSLSLFSGTNPNGTWSLYVVDDEDLDIGRINDGWSMRITTLGPLADLALNMTDAPDPITIGSNLTYSITVSNRGPAAATSVVLTDALPDGASFVSANSSVGSCGVAGGVVTCQLGTLNAAQSAQVQIMVSPLRLGMLTNSASVRAAQLDNTPANNSAVALTGISAAADLALLPTSVPSESLLGSEVIYVIGMTNRGTIGATSSRVEVVWPDWINVNGVTVSQGSCGPENGKLVCNLGTLFGLSSAQLTLRLLPLAPGILTNKLSLRANEFDPNQANNLLEARTEVVVLGQGNVPSSIALPTSGAGSPYPSTIVLSGLTTAVARVSVTLSNLTHPSPDDLDILLVGPGGQKVMLLSDAGGAIAAGNVTLTFDDAAAGVVSDNGPLGSGQFRPSVYDAVSDPLPAPAPGAPYGNTLAAFNSTNPNGTWSLYVFDDLAPSSGLIAGWSLRVTTREPLVDLGVTLAGPPDPIAVSSNVTYLATVTNRGPSTAWEVNLQNPFDPSFDLVSAIPSQGSCSNVNGVLNCDLGSVTPGGSAMVVLILKPARSGSVTNIVNVSGRGIDVGPLDNTASAVNFSRNPPTIIARPPDQTVTNGHTIVFTAVVSGDAPLSYQWYHDDMPLPNANSLTLVIPNVAASDEGSYLLFVSNSVGVAQSGAARLIVLHSPIISEFDDLDIHEDTATGPIFFSVMDAESATFTLMVRAVSSDPVLVPAAGLRLMADTFGLNRSLTVTPGTNQFGSALISVLATDEDGLTSTNSFTLTVSPINDPPDIATIPNQETVPNGTLDVPIEVSDPESPAQQVNVTASADNPAIIQSVTVLGTDAERIIRIVPVADVTGLTFVTVTARDPQNAQSTRVFQFNITSNTRPTIQVPPDQVLDEDVLSPAWSFVIGDRETSANQLSVTAVSANPAIVPNNQIFLGGSDSNRTVSVLGATNRSGNVFIYLMVRDGTGFWTTNFFSVTVNLVNDAPQLSSLPNQTMEPSRTLALPVTVRDEEDQPELLGFSARSSNLTLLPNSGVVAAGTTADRTLTLTPTAGQTGTATVSYWATDTEGKSSTNSFVVQVQAQVVQQAPVITTQPQSLLAVEGETVHFNVGVVGTAPLRYQWRFNNVNIAGGTNASLAVKDLNPALAGDYTVQVTNQFGSTVSWPARLSLIPVTTSPTLIATGSVWSYLDTGTNLGFSWRQLDFDDAAWAKGPAELGYGDSVDGRPEATVVGFGPNPNNRYITTYFRHRFVVRDPFAYTSLLLRLIRDDGAVVYLNGAEVFRSNLPAGIISSATPASSDVIGSAEAFFVSQSVNPALLQAGANVLSVEIHQVNGLSPDLSFDLEFTGTLNNASPPTLLGLGNRTTIEDVPVTISFTIGDMLVPAELLKLSATSSSATLLPPANIYFDGTSSNRTVTLIPAAEESGSATVTIFVSNGAATNQQSFTLTVNLINDPPTLDPVADVALVQGASDFTVNLTGISRGPANEATGSIRMQNSTTSDGTKVGIGTRSYSSPQTTATQRISPVAAGASLITVNFDDDQTGNPVVSRQFTAYVRASNNQPPTISNVGNRNVTEGQSTGPIAFTVGDLETAAGSLTVRARSFNTALVPEGNILLGGSGASRTVTITPAANQSGSAQIWLMVVDQGFGMVATNFTLTVAKVNDPPSISPIVNQSVSANGRTAPIPFTVQDQELIASQLTVSASATDSALVPPQNLVIAGTSTNRALIVQPALNRSGSTLITVAVSDGISSRSTQFTLTVLLIEQPPSLSDIGDVVVNEDATSTPIAFTVFDEQTAAGSLLVTATSSDQVMIPNAGLLVTGTTGARALTITPSGNQFGQAVVTVRVRDASGLEAIDNVLVRVDPVNDAPELDPIADRGASGGVAVQTVLLTGIRAGPGNEVQTLALSATSSRPDLIPDPIIRYTNGLTTGVLYFHPVPASSGSVTITVRVNDGQAINNLFARDFNIQLISGLQIVGQPQSQMVEAGQPAAFLINAVGQGTLRYQWRKDGGILPGETNAMLLLPTVQPRQAGQYAVMVSDSSSSLLSANAQLVVTARLMIVELIRGSPTRVRFQAEAGLNCTLYYKDTLESSNWTPLGSTVGTGGISELTDPNPSAIRRFYTVWGQ